MDNMNEPRPAPGNETGLPALERKFARFGEAVEVKDGIEICGYASFFGDVDQGGDVVERGAYGASLKALAAAGRSVKMLWQHDPAQPIGVWDEVREDARGLWVKGRILEGVEKGREAAALIAAGAIDGLSIGYRTVKAAKNTKGQRLLQELELWEVSLVTFPMLPSARVDAKGADPLDATLRDMAAAFEGARAKLARGKQDAKRG
ncbi:MAG: HK97 family phage prohead protease [Pseudomonadota bacterium]